ncbi:MAG: peptidylprolyl isomerase [Bacteroidales bacterium]|nr:peptidylprolyl isomerase [Bacteroidales bacterium]
MKKNLITVLVLLTATIMSVNAQKKEKPVEFIIETSYGNIEGFLYDDTPLHRDNFVKLVNEGWYDDSPFHRVINNFMIQGGHNKDGRVDPGYTIPAEFRNDHIHKKGTLAAARMGDQVNPEKASSGCQFYIVQGTVTAPAMLNQIVDQRRAMEGNLDQHLMKILQKPENQEIFQTIQTKIQSQEYEEAEKLLEPYVKEAEKLAGVENPFSYTEEQIKEYSTIGGTPHLDGSYTVFGELTKGLDVVDKIAAVKTGANDVPVEAVTMKIKIK